MASPAAAGRECRRARPGPLIGLAAAGLALCLAACSGTSAGRPAASGSGSSSSSSSSTTSPDPSVRLDSTGSTVSFQSPVRLVVANGSFSAVQVSASGADLAGTVSGDGASWLSTDPPKPAQSYQVTASVKNQAGQSQTKTLSFTVDQVPDSQRLSFTVSPGDGSTVGIGEPIVVRFLSKVTERAAIEKAMTVTAKSPSGAPVAGSWHWLTGQEVHWRPQEFWTPGTTVQLQMGIGGVKGATNRYGRKDYSETFTIGSSHITYVDASAHQAKVYRDGALVATWAAGTGRPGLETYSGTYIVLGKAQVVQMDSCSARVTCDKTNPDYYNEKEYWATRVTASGTFLHAASWDGLLGKANVSHGCIHLSDTNAQEFYNHAVIGDVVIVKNTGRGPEQRIATMDPGLIDWNLPWSTWVAGSALS